MIIAGYSGIGKTYYADHTEGVLDFHIVPYKYRFLEGYDPSTYTEADKARNDLEFDPDYPTLYCHDLIKYKDEYEHVVIPSDPRVLALTQKWLRLLTGYKQQEKIRVRFFDPETASVKQTEMYVEGFKAKLKKDTSYKGLWIVSFVLKEI